MPRDYKVSLDDILEAVDRIEDYTAGMDKERFQADRKTFDAVVRNLEIIGEATENIPAHVRGPVPACALDEDRRDAREFLTAPKDLTKPTKLTKGAFRQFCQVRRREYSHEFRSARRWCMHSQTGLRRDPMRAKGRPQWRWQISDMVVRGLIGWRFRIAICIPQRTGVIDRFAVRRRRHRLQPTTPVVTLKTLRPNVATMV